MPPSTTRRMTVVASRRNEGTSHRLHRWIGNDRYMIRRRDMGIMRINAGAQEVPRHLQETETHQVGAERDAQIDHPTRPLEFRRHLIAIEFVNIDGAQR